MTSHAPLLANAVIDGIGRRVPVLGPPRRIVSLVPSLTEALFALALDRAVVGRTEYCVAPAERVPATPTVGGTKTPDLEAIVRLEPELVIASAEENVREHVEALIERGLRVYVSLAATVAQAIDELADLVRLCGRDEADAPWLGEARAAVAEVAERRRGSAPVRYFCPIWRRPYMVAAPETYMSDLLRLCGGENVFGEGPARYYAVELAEAARRAPAVVLLPDEPYPFAEKHRAEIAAYGEMPAVQAGRMHLIDGQWITWYGPRMAEGILATAAHFDGA